MRWRALALMVLLITVPFPAAGRERVCLVLGGGGARGAAHIGVLKVLERERIAVDCIAGTSMGAVVGAMYAMSYSPDEIERVLANVDWRDLFDDDPGRAVLPIRRKNDALDLLVDFQFGLRNGRIVLPTGALQGQKLLLLLRRLALPAWNVDDFDALPIPFRAVATDIGKGETVVFDDGDLALALRASMSVPAVFAPIRVDGRLLIDGAITDNVPIRVARAMGAERLIAVDVSALMEPEENLDSAVAISAQMLTALMKRVTAEQLATLGPRDVLITPDLEGIGGGAFERSVDAIPRGAAAAEAALAALRTMAVDAATYAAYRERQQALEFDPPLIAFLDTLPHDSRTAGYVEQRLARHRGARFDAERVESDVGAAFGEGRYERIGYRLVERDGLVGLEIEPIDKSWGPNYLRFGLDISDDFEGESDYALTVQSSLTGLDSRGAEWRNTLKLGRVTGLRSEYYQPFGSRGQYFANAYLDYRALDQPFGAQSRGRAVYRLESETAGLEGGVNVSPSLRLLGGVARGHDAARLRIGDPLEFPDASGNFGGYYLGLTHDTLDDSQFPGAGDRIDLRVDAYRAGLGADTNGEVLRLAADTALSRGKNRLLLGVRASSELDGRNLLRGTALLGGFLNLSGFPERALFGSQVGLARAVYYRRLGDESALFSLPFYVGGSLEAGNVWGRRADVDVGELILAGSLFVGMESFLGPMFLGVGHAETGDTSFYLRFGSLLRTER